MDWTNYVSDVVETLHPGTMRGREFCWGFMPEKEGPSMTSWDESRLGPLNMKVIKKLAQERLVKASVIELPSPADISDRQFFDGLRKRRLISDDEFLAAVSVGAIPQIIQQIMDTQGFKDALTALGIDLISAKGMLMGDRIFEYNNNLTPLLADGLNWTEAETRDFWLDCAKN